MNLQGESPMKRYPIIVFALFALLLLGGCNAAVPAPQAEATPSDEANVSASVEDESTSEAEASAPAADGEECRTIIHDMGETEVCGTPKTVIALGPHMLDILLSLGVQAAGFAETQFINEEDWGQPVGNILYLGDYVETMPINVGDRLDPNLEVITSLHPDLILSELRDEAQMELLQQIAPTLAYQGNQADEWQRTIVPIAEALNIPQEAERVIAEHEAYIAEKRAELEPIIAEHPRVTFVSQNQDGVLSTFTTISWVGGLLADLGFELAFFPSERTATEVSVEQFPELETDIIIVGASGTATPEIAQELWTSNPVLMAHPASAAGRVYFVDYQLWSRLRGPISSRLVTEELIRLLGAE
jgi:iron complex transport system substrate-binding protein